MNNNNCDNSFELYARHHAQQDTPASNDARTGVDVTDATSESNQNHNDEFNPPATISIISDPQQSGRPAVITPPPPAAAAPTQARPPSIKFKLNRKRSSTGSDAADRSETTNNRTKGRSTLTSSFLRRKRIEYAGTKIYDS